MPVRKIAISITEELDEALTLASLEMDLSKSRVIETLLREHAVVQRRVKAIRAEPRATVYAAGGKARRVTRPPASASE